MTPIKTDLCNFAYTAPPGMTEEQCGTLHCRRDTDQGIVTSYWQPEPEERSEIVNGALIALTVHGHGHPPVAIGTCPVETKDYQDPLQAIRKNLHTQDNRCTANPAFCVQVLERIGPIMPEHGSGNVMFHDHQDCETYYEDRPDPEEWQRLKALDDSGDLPDHITLGSYIEKWITVQTCFTEHGCKLHLEQNGHNYRHHFGTRIYAESFHRNPEMLAIRKALMEGAL